MVTLFIISSVRTFMVIFRVAKVGLYAVASPMNLKIKYHNVHDKPTTTTVNLTIAKIIYKSLQHDQREKGKEKSMEINMASLVG